MKNDPVLIWLILAPISAILWALFILIGLAILDFSRFLRELNKALAKTLKQKEAGK